MSGKEKEVKQEDEVIEELPEEELSELKKWLLEATAQEEVALAKAVVSRAIAVEKSLPQIGMLAVMVGPGGTLQSLISQNLADDDGMDNVEAALLDIQRNILQARRQNKLQSKAIQEVPESKEE